MKEDLAWAFRRGEGRPPLVYGHRGVRGSLPENTLAAFDAAAREGADGIELDVRLSRDGAVVVAHDPALGRVTNGADDRLIADVDAAELARVDLGGGERLPRLVDALAIARRHGLVVNVEMKRDVPSRRAVVAAVARVLRTWDRAHPVLVSSFDPLMLAGIRLAHPRTPLALLVHRGGLDEHTMHLARSPLADAANIERTLASPAMVRALRARGVLVNVWTVNDATETRDLAALGVDGLITDAPASARAAMAE